ncbi:MAG: phospholipid/cholesterol/gamma-HCH transport system substrate-binding protein [Solirubrobacteraceae bacterium]|jgi:virulence factor Mce-like protein|nr:phospholipid/cholesterol/gamma-HCH transport system substrate-binding protein [Solirubrobacteraceae bacterium]
METGSPSIAKIASMVAFALSVVGLLLFMWLSFGGPIPFNPQGYRVRIAFPDASQLADQADVRIAGVSVGKVINKSLDPKGNRTIATIQMNNNFAPIHKDARAILREKTILGETYVELTPGTPHSANLPDNGLLARSNVQPTVQLDQIFNALNPATRDAFKQWQQELAKSIKGNDQNLNSVLGNLPSFAADATNLLQVLDVQHAAVVRLVQNGGTVFAALSKSQSALRTLITTGETTFHTTAVNNTAIENTFHVFPTFLNQTKLTMQKLQSFSLNTDPLIKQLEPVAANLKPTLAAVRQLSPYLRSFFTNLGPLITASKTGLPATRDVLKGATPLLGSLGPFLEQLNPIFTWLSLHQQLVSDFISNGAGGLAAKTTAAAGSGSPGHYLRQFGPTGAETLSFAANRDPDNRGNTYPPPLWLSDPRAFTAGGNFPGSFAFPSWDCTNAGGNKPASGTPTQFTQGQQACWQAPPLSQLLGQNNASRFPQVKAAKYSKK